MTHPHKRRQTVIVYYVPTEDDGTGTAYASYHEDSVRALGVEYGWRELTAAAGADLVRRHPVPVAVTS